MGMKIHMKYFVKMFLRFKNSYFNILKSIKILKLLKESGYCGKRYYILIFFGTIFRFF